MESPSLRRLVVEERVRAAAGRGLQVLTRQELLECGLSVDAIRHWERRGRLRRLHHGVYLVGTVLPPHARDRAAILATRGVMAHESAGHLFELRPVPAVPHVAVTGRNPKPTGIVVHRYALSRAEITHRHGLPVTTPLRTVLDLAGSLPTGELEQVIAEAEARRLLTSSALAAFLERTPARPGGAKLRQILRTGPRLTRSELEDRFLALTDRAGLARPETNARIGPYEVDALWREENLVVELDGYAFHSSRRSFEEDRRRDAELASRGLRTMRLTWRRIDDEPEAVVAELARALVVT